MGEFYQDMADMTRELLAPTDEGGLGQGCIEIVRYLASPAQPDPWSPPNPSIPRAKRLDGVVRGVGKEMVGAPVENGGQIIATDLIATVAPWDGPYDPADVIKLDGKAVTVLSVKNIPAVGTVAAVQMVLRR
ncbi:hypothetical protein [Sphingobium yanoikuyae]|uniref:hypothetical protein n=1 Tax=Sphingobium yanoikuyae TaxID=13690 RepID=UPI0026E9808A|nr:hypothetical protein [Sphingobium yanoikuyae]